MKKLILKPTILILLAVITLSGCEDSNMVEKLPENEIQLPVPDNEIKNGVNARVLNNVEYYEDFNSNWFEFLPIDAGAAYNCGKLIYTSEKNFLDNTVIWLDDNGPVVPWYFHNAKIRKRAYYTTCEMSYQAQIQHGGFVAMNFIYPSPVNKIEIFASRLPYLYPDDCYWNEIPLFDVYIFKSGQWQLLEHNLEADHELTTLTLDETLNGAAVAIIASPFNCMDMVVFHTKMYWVPVFQNP